MLPPTRDRDAAKQVHLTDWKRVLLGDASFSFLLEVLLRTALVYLVLVVVLRLFGKRMSGQLTILEMAVMITLGAIVSMPMQVPGQGIGVGIVLLVCVLVLQRGLSRLGVRSRKVELLSQGDLVPLVKDGVILTDQMRRAALSHQQLYAALREKGIQQLGEVKRVYLEACGLFSIFRNHDPSPGLCVLPEKDDGMMRRCVPERGRVACATCAWVVDEGRRGDRCPNCGAFAWMPAVRRAEAT